MKNDLPRLSTVLLYELWTKWKADSESQRFGQYVWNRTIFSLDEVNGVMIYFDKHDEKVLEALREYLESIHA